MFPSVRIIPASSGIQPTIAGFLARQSDVPVGIINGNTLSVPAPCLPYPLAGGTPIAWGPLSEGFGVSPMAGAPMFGLPVLRPAKELLPKPAVVEKPKPTAPPVEKVAITTVNAVVVIHDKSMHDDDGKPVPHFLLIKLDKEGPMSLLGNVLTEDEQVEISKDGDDLTHKFVTKRTKSASEQLAFVFGSYFGSIDEISKKMIVPIVRGQNLFLIYNFGEHDLDEMIGDGSATAPMFAKRNAEHVSLCPNLHVEFVPFGDIERATPESNRVFKRGELVFGFAPETLRVEKHMLWHLAQIAAQCGLV